MVEAQWPPLLLRNARGLAETTDPTVKARLLADRIGLLARHGFTGHADALLPEARDAVLELDDGEAFVRLAISEAIACYYGPSPTRLLDVFDTAIEAAREHRLPELEAEAGLWAAAYRRTWGIDVNRTIQHLEFALQHAGPLCESTLPRALYLAGNYFAIAGLSDEARRCHHEAMRLARRAEDVQLCEGIATYPMLVELNEARAQHAKGLLSKAAAGDLEERLRAAAAQRTYIGKRAQIYIHWGETLRLLGRHAEAAKLLGLYLPQGQVEGLNESELLVGRSDRAVCLLQLRDARAASQERRHLRSALASQMSHYARAALLTNLVEMEQLLGRPEAAAELAARAADAWAQRERDNAAYRMALEQSDLPALLPAPPHLSLVQRTVW